MWKTAEGSTGRLIQLCVAMFFTYVIYGVATKAFSGSTAIILPEMGRMSFLVWSTLGGTTICIGVVLVGRWWKGQAARFIQVGPLRVPAEFAYIIPSGICTAIIIPSTTLLYILLKSVMVAMVIMRASVILSSRLVDMLQIRQGILKKAVYWQENIAVVFAVSAAGTQILLAKSGDFDFLHSKTALVVMGCFMVAYAIRIYVMNYYKNTRPKGEPHNNKWFFSIEQITASTTLALAVLWFASSRSQAAPVLALQDALSHPHPNWLPVVGLGGFYGMVALFGVFIFMFKGRTATFSGLAYSQTSLAAGTTATLISAFLLGGHFPSVADWVSLALIVVAFGFLALSERRRVVELARANEMATGTRAPEGVGAH